MKEGIVRPTRVVNLRSIPGLDGITFARRGPDASARWSRWRRSRRRRTFESTIPRSRRLPPMPRRRKCEMPPRSAATCCSGRAAGISAASISIRTSSTSARPSRRREPVSRHLRQFPSALVHASTPATALIAYGAAVHLTSRGQQTRTVPLERFLLPPDPTRDRDAAIQSGEILTEVIVPADPPRRHDPPITSRPSATATTGRFATSAVVLQMDGDGRRGIDRHGLGRADAPPGARKRSAS